MIIKFLNCSLTNLEVIIYDNNNNIIDKQYIINNQININISNGIYKLFIINNNTLINKTTLLINDKYKCLTYTFPSNTNNRLRKIIITDYYYPNLKIERGSLLLKIIT